VVNNGTLDVQSGGIQINRLSGTSSTIKAAANTSVSLNAGNSNVLSGSQMHY
jgi:hypothetical protein